MSACDGLSMIDTTKEPGFEELWARSDGVFPESWRITIKDGAKNKTWRGMISENATAMATIITKRYPE